MIEKWREPFEDKNLPINEELDMLFEAASLNYLSNEAKMADFIFGKSMKDYEDNVLRVTLANWQTKSRIVVEKPLSGADESYTRSMFLDEDSNISFTIYIYDLLQEDINVPVSAGLRGSVEFMQIEIYEDNRLALLYFGRPNSQEIDDEEDESDEDSGEYNFVLLNPEGSTLLGVDYSEEGTDVHDRIKELIRVELGIDYWQNEYHEALSDTLDNIAIYCSENEE